MGSRAEQFIFLHVSSSALLLLFLPLYCYPPSLVRSASICLSCDCALASLLFSWNENYEHIQARRFYQTFAASSTLQFATTLLRYTNRQLRKGILRAQHNFLHRMTQITLHISLSTELSVYIDKEKVRRDLENHVGEYTFYFFRIWIDAHVI